jgi:hypothetical protein
MAARLNVEDESSSLRHSIGDGEFHRVKGHELRQVLAPSPVKLVLLNACWSATKRGVSLCDFLTREQVADAAIGHERPVADESAVEFGRQSMPRSWKAGQSVWRASGRRTRWPSKASSEPPK